MTLQEDLDRDAYSVELVNIFNDIVELLDKTPIKNFRKEIITHSDLRKHLNEPKSNFKEIYINELILPRILSYCKEMKINFADFSSKGEEIYVPHSHRYFGVFLALKLIVCDANAIRLLLDWNNKEYHSKENYEKRIITEKSTNQTLVDKWEEERPFTLQVEHVIYNLVTSWIPVTDKLRLRTIMNWVDINKSYITKKQAYKYKKKSLKIDKPNYKTFDELFWDKDSIEFCIDALRKVTPAVIDKESQYLLGVRRKSAIVAWVDVIKARKKIREVTDENLASLLNNYFKGINFSKDGRTLRSPGIAAAYKKYHNQFTELISLSSFIFLYLLFVGLGS